MRYLFRISAFPNSLFTRPDAPTNAHLEHVLSTDALLHQPWYQPLQPWPSLDHPQVQVHDKVCQVKEDAAHTLREQPYSWHSRGEG